MKPQTILKALAFSVAVTGGTELRAAPTTTMVGDGELVISFTEVGSHTWVAPTDISGATVLIVGGGGGGGGGVSAGGGGAGQVILASNQVFTAGTSYALMVGAGGAGGANKNPGAKGAASSFGDWTADGGGAGDHSEAKAAETGANGGGDGAKNSSVPVPGTGETKVDGSVYFYGGHAGGASLRSLWAGGGGGGAQGDGASATTLGVGGTGGDGLPLDITGETVFYACGGGGGINIDVTPDVTPGKGGSEGVSGGSALLTGGEAGRANTGTGGGGGSYYAGTAQPGGAGGSGIVVIRYKSPTAYAVVTGYEGLLDGTAHGATIAGLYPSEGATVWYAADADAAWTTEPIAFGTKGTHTIRVKITAEGLKDFETSVTVSLTDEPGVTDGSVCLVAPAGGSTPTAPYATWATAANDLATALDAVKEGGTVYVAPGTYALSQALSVKKALTLRGFDRETGADNPEKVVLDGQNACRVLSANVGTAAPIFRGLTFARGTNATGEGGGVFLQGVAGASIPRTLGEAPSFVNCTFTNCTAKEQGAALHVQGRVFVQGCRFVGNVTASGSYGNTVSVRAPSGATTAAAAFIDCAFTEDATAIPANASTLALRGHGNLVSNCVFTTCGSANRGVIVSDSTSVSAANTIIANCICRDAGAPFVAPIEGNSYGGVAIRNCLVVGGKGYGIVTGTGRTEIDNCTITGQRLAGIQVKGECVVRNTIAWNNNGTKADLELGADAVYSEVTSSTGWDGAAVGVNAVNPVFRNAAAGDYSLKRRTPHLDKGTVLDWMTTGTTDLAGRPRVATNGRPLSVDADAKPDLGCYENQEIRKGLCVLIR